MAGRIPDRPTKEMLLSLVPDLEIRNFLIDDGWQDIRKHSSRLQGQLYSFDCWDGMGASMPDVVSALKIKGIEEVGVWLTLQGYWWSIDPDSPLAQRYNCMPHRTARSGQPRGGVVIPLEPAKPEEDQWLPSPEMAGQFWEDWFTEMKSWGVGFVKVSHRVGFEVLAE